MDSCDGYGTIFLQRQSFSTDKEFSGFEPKGGLIYRTKRISITFRLDGGLNRYFVIVPDTWTI